MDISSLNSLKVADLKQLLKARGLSLVGNKSELVQRLESAMLSDSSSGTAVMNVSKEIDEDAILADDDEGYTAKADESLLHNEELLLGETSIVTASNTNNLSAAAVTAPKIVAPTVTPISSSPATAAVNSKPSVVTSPTNAAEKPDTANNVSSQNQTTGTLKNILTPEQKKEIRAQKFADPKLQNRAERFGVQLATKPANENDKLKQRMSRFGEAISEKAKTMEEQERIDKRKERFGVVAPSSKTTATNGVKRPATNPIVNEKIQKRQERFGVVEEKKDTNKILPGFKRRRFAH